MTAGPRLATVTIVGTLAYLALAMLGWGGFAAFFSHPARIALTIAVCVMSGAALFSGGNLNPGEREDRTNRWVLVAFGNRAAGRLICRPTRTGRRSGLSTEIPFAGLASLSLSLVVRCVSGQSLSWGAALAGWSPSSPGIRWSPLVSIGSSATRATWGCSSTRWGGPWSFVRASACY
jgi:hypothetical protein